MHIRSLRDYVEQLRAEPDELNALYQDLLIGVTQFFRDPEAYGADRAGGHPAAARARARRGGAAAVAAGCATGEEAYSLAMLLWEAFAARSRPMHLKILATDVHQASLELAGAGVYGEAAAQRLPRAAAAVLHAPLERLPGLAGSPAAHRVRAPQRHQATRRSRRCTSSRAGTCSSTSQPHAQRTVLSLFHFGLVSGGTLFLGASETPARSPTSSSSIDEHWKLFRKRRDVHLLSQVRMPLYRGAARRAPVAVDVPRTHGPDPLILHTYDQLLDRYMPPGFLIDEDRMLIDLAGAERLLAWRRRPSSNLLELLEEDLRGWSPAQVQRR